MEKTFMEIALQQANVAKAKGEVPIGAVVVFENKVLAKAHNETITKHDPSGHAEIIAMREAARILQNARLNECDLYTTLEPCAMCAGAISHARIRRLYYGAADEKGGAIENTIQFFQNKNSLHKIEIYGGICETQAKEMLQEFFKAKR